MGNLLKTVLYQHHVALEAQMVEFGGWSMPVQYPGGILEEHLATRRGAGLFDVSHMGRFIISGREGLGFLQHALTNNAAALEPGQSQTVRFTVPMSALGFYNREMAFVVEPGVIEVMVGSSVEDIRLRGQFEIVGETRSVGADKTFFSTVTVLA